MPPPITHSYPSHLLDRSTKTVTPRWCWRTLKESLPLPVPASTPRRELSQCSWLQGINNIDLIPDEGSGDNIHDPTERSGS